MTKTGLGKIINGKGKKANILLISTQVDLTVMGLKYLHYILLRAGYQSYYLHVPRYHPESGRVLENIGKFISQINPAFIGIGLMTEEYNRVRHLSGYLKKKFPAIPIIWGGIHPTVDAESCFPFADYVCIGEGFKVILDLANAISEGKDPGSISNLCYQEHGQIKRNPLHPMIENLDELPIFDHIAKNAFIQDGSGIVSEMNLRLFKKYDRYRARFYDIVTSLGCHLACTFCSSSFLSGIYGSNRVRMRSLENIILELSKAIQDYPFIEMVNFQDENFLSYSLDFFSKFKDAYRTKVARPFMFACTPMFVTREKIAILKEAGLIWIRMGLQSGSDRVLKEIYKRKSLTKHFLDAMEIFKQFKIAVYCDAILDNPLETAQDQIETIKVLLKPSRPFYFQPYSLTTFCGTELHEIIRKECPDKFEDPTAKVFLAYKKTTLNNLTRISAYVPRKLIYKLIELYERDQESMFFKILYLGAKMLGVLFFEPIAFFRVFRISQGGSTIKVLKMLLVYKKIWFSRYSAHFKTH